MPGAKKTLVLVSLLAISLFAGKARAQASDGAGSAVSQPRPGGLSAEQLQAFADLTGDSPHIISLRLSRDPNLAPMVASAADARQSRKRTGLVMTIVGFTILGVGDAVGAYIMFSTPGYPDVKGHEGQFFTGAAIALGAVVVGLAVGIPGIVKMVAPSDDEAAALDYYAPRRASRSSWGHSPTSVEPGTVLVPVFSGSF